MRGDHFEPPFLDASFQIIQGIFTARIRRMGEGNVFSLFTSGGGGGVPVSHNALQHFPECHGAAGGGYPARSSPAGGGVPWQVQLGGIPWPGGYPGWGVPWPGGTLAGGVPWPGGYPGWGGTLAGGVPWPGGTLAGGGTQLGQHREYLLHSGRYASCVHAGGLSCIHIFHNLIR